MLNIGWTFRLLGELKKAEDWLVSSIKIKPIRDAYRELGYTYVQQGHAKKAIELIPEVVNLEAGNSRIYEEAALIGLFANNRDSALYYFKKSAELNANLENDENTLAPLALAYFMINSQQRENALDELNRLHELYMDLISSGSQDDDLRIYLAAVMSIQGNEDEAISWLGRAIDANWVDFAMITHIPWFQQLRANPSYNLMSAKLEARLEEMRLKAANLD